MVQMAHRVLPGKVSDFAYPAQRQNALVFEPHDEVAAFACEIAVKCGPVAAPVVHGHVPAARRGVHGHEDLQHLVVFALEVRCA